MNDVLILFFEILLQNHQQLLQLRRQQLLRQQLLQQLQQV